MSAYVCGALPSPPDARDYSVRMLRPVTALPQRFKQNIGKNYEQVAGNCVIQTYRNIMREIYDIEFGVDMGYGGAREHSSPGLYPATAANFVCKHGLCPKKYDSKEREVTAVIDYYRANKEALHERAAPYAGMTWARAYTAEQIKAALHSGMYVAGCFAISQIDCKSNGIFPCTEARQGYHEMRIYGWDVVDGREYACVQNSWGSSWGRDGECFVSWDDVLRVGDVIVFSPGERRCADDTDSEPDADIRRTLRRGMKGDDVAELQKILLSIGYNLGDYGADGSFGSLTKAAVVLFQSKHDLTADGIVGPKTWEVLDTV